MSAVRDFVGSAAKDNVVEVSVALRPDDDDISVAFISDSKELFGGITANHPGLMGHAGLSQRLRPWTPQQLSLIHI